MRAARKPCWVFLTHPFYVMLCCITSVILSRTLRNFSKINFNELHPARLSSCSQVTQQQCKQSTGQYQLTWWMQLIIKINFFHDEFHPARLSSCSTLTLRKFSKINFDFFLFMILIVIAAADCSVSSMKMMMMMMMTDDQSCCSTIFEKKVEK